MDFQGKLNAAFDKIKSVFSKDNSFFYGGNGRGAAASPQAYEQYASPQPGTYPNAARQQMPINSQAPYGQQAVAPPYAPYQTQNAPYQGNQQPSPMGQAGSAPQGYPQPNQPAGNPYQNANTGHYQSAPSYQQQAPQAFSSPQEAQLYQQPDMAGRNRRAAAHPQQAEPDGTLLQFPGSEQAESEPRQRDAYVVNITGITGCRQAMTCLRKGQCTLVVMDQLIDKGEVRRYVDMLNGACFALGGTMTRLSLKVGFYILAPSGMMVYTDPVTANANAPQPQQAPAPARPVSQAAPVSPGYAYPPPPAPSAQQEYPQQPYQQMPGYNPQQSPAQPAAPIYSAPPQGSQGAYYMPERFAQ